MVRRKRSSNGCWRSRDPPRSSLGTRRRGTPIRDVEGDERPDVAAARARDADTLRKMRGLPDVYGDPRERRQNVFVITDGSGVVVRAMLGPSCEGERMMTPQAEESESGPLPEGRLHDPRIAKTDLSCCDKAFFTPNWRPPRWKMLPGRGRARIWGGAILGSA